VRLIRVFPRRTSLTPTDELAFVGSPPLDRPQADEVHVSCAFTWDKDAAVYLVRAWGQYYSNVKLGGPAYEGPDGFVPGQYVKTGVTFTSRGCNNHCPWCLVPKREGRLTEYEDFAPGRIINDNNLLQCNHAHLDRVLTMLRHEHMIFFSGGLDARLLTSEIADELRSLAIRELFLACDTAAALKPLRLAVQRLQMPRDKVRCYVLLAFNGEMISQANARLEDVWHAGVMPFAQLYQPPDRWIDYSKEWRGLARTWSRPAAMKSLMGAAEGVSHEKRTTSTISDSH